MTPEDVKRYFGNSYQFKKKTKMSDASFRNWMEWGFVPEASQYKLERITSGELKASIVINERIREDEETIQAKKLLKCHMKFLASLLKLLEGNDLLLKKRAIWTIQCLNRYIDNRLIIDIESAIKNNGNASNGD